jgi:hypothetical protein
MPAQRPDDLWISTAVMAALQSKVRFRLRLIRPPVNDHAPQRSPSVAASDRGRTFLWGCRLRWIRLPHPPPHAQNPQPPNDSPRFPSWPIRTKSRALPRYRDRYVMLRNEDMVEKLQAFAQSRGHTMLELAFSWLASRPQVASVIAGARASSRIQGDRLGAKYGRTRGDRCDYERVMHFLSLPTKVRKTRPAGRYNGSMDRQAAQTICRCSSVFKIVPQS